MDFLKATALRFLIAYPICFYLYGSIGAALACMSHFFDECVPIVVFSPIFLIFGPIGHDDEDPPNVFLRVFIVTLVAVAIWALIAIARKRDRTKR
jgi:hypothetical protein